MEDKYLFSFLKNPSPSQLVPGRASPDAVVFQTAADFGTFVGPVTLNVSVEAGLRIDGAGGGDAPAWVPLHSFEVKLAAGREWGYRFPLYTPFSAEGGDGRVVIRPAHHAARGQAVCDTADIPCGFGVADIADSGKFFPSPCEGCPPGAPVVMPPGCSTALNTPPAKGGFVRPRFYNGMCVTRDDFETWLRFERLKRQTANKALGAGVGWGLGVSMSGRAVRVAAGYGRDCCGHDLIVTCPYEVPAAVLLADPLACDYLRDKKTARMHLLLEYVECPEEPRPVHADGCATAAPACEMSRVRETVRLRLVPPRDYTPDGPIDDFLAAVRKNPAGAERAGFSLAGLFAGAAAPPAAEMPFGFKFELTRSRSDAEMTPPLDGQPAVERDLGSSTPEPERLQISIVPKDGFVVSAGTLSKSPDSRITLAALADTGTTKNWRCDISREESPFTLTFKSWVLRRDGVDYSGSTEVAGKWSDIGPQLPPVGGFNNRWRLTINPTRVSVSGRGPVEIPCLSEACDPSGSPRFPAFPPFDHADPAGGVVPADPRVWLLAGLHALLLLTAKDGQVGAAAARLYAAAWTTLFRVKLTPDVPDILQRLLRDWCEKLLYPGPDCDRKPDGVVVGCARIEGGEICGVDSWGGRRWAVHYPLLAYWGEQFGLTPPDVIASRVFDLICCIGGRPPLRFDADTRTRAMFDRSFSGVAGVTVFPLGQSAVLAFGEEPAVSEAAGGLGGRDGAVRRLALPQFILAVMAARNSPPVTGDARYTHTTTDLLPTVHLLVRTPAGGAAPDAKPGLVAGLVRANLQAVPPLLRTFAANLSAELLQAVPLPDPSAPVARSLAAAGVTTLGALLSRDPEEVFTTALGGQNAEKFSALWQAAEKAAGETATAVARALPTGAVVRAAFAPGTPQRAALRKAVAEGPGRGLEAARLDAALDAAYNAKPGDGP